MTQSYTLTMPPVAACLRKGAAFIDDRHGILPTWKGRNEMQRQLLEWFYEKIDVDSIPELKTIADINVDVINEFLVYNGFDIQLKPCPDPLAFYVASIFDLLLKWSMPGTEHDIQRFASVYKGARITDHFAIYEGACDEPVARLTCENGDHVFMTPMRKPMLPFELARFIFDLQDTLRQNFDYKAVVFPAIKFEEYPDLSWMEGKYEGIYEDDTGPGLTYYVYEAKQQTKVAMDHLGAHVESAAAMTFAGSGYGPSLKKPKPDFVIDQPFVVWIQRSTVPVPIFAGHFFEDAWRLK